MTFKYKEPSLDDIMITQKKNINLKLIGAEMEFKANCVECKQVVTLTNKMKCESKKIKESFADKRSELEGKMVVFCPHCKKPFFVKEI